MMDVNPLYAGPVRMPVEKMGTRLAVKAAVFTLPSNFLFRMRHGRFSAGEGMAVMEGGEGAAERFVGWG